MFNILFIFIMTILMVVDRVAPESKNNSVLFPSLTYTESINERNIVMSTEQWESIPEFPNYQFNPNTLEVKSIARDVPFRWFNRPIKERILKPRETSGGYYQFVLTNESGTRGLQRSQISWLVQYGELPSKGIHIDHINNNTKDDRIENLQLLTIRENTTKGKVLKGRDLPIGVYWNESNKKYRVKIHINGKQVHLGYFDTIDKASLIYQKALAKIV